MNELEFVEDVHKYYYKGKELKGTTSLIKEFVPEFDANYWAAKKARERNMPLLKEGEQWVLWPITQQMILDEWDVIRDRASLRGKFIHSYLEDTLSGIKRYDDDLNLGGVHKYLENDYYGDVIGCEMMFHDDWFAGTADLLVKHQGKKIIRDWKTNRQFRKVCPYKTRMLNPLGRLHATEYYVYTLQLNMYRYLMKDQHDVEKLEIVWFDHDGNYEVIELPIVEDVLLSMLNAYKKGK